MASARSRRSDERDAEARAALQPLAPGERPRAVTVAALVALALAALVLIGHLTDTRVGGQRPSIPALIALEVILLAAAAGMWQGRYGAVLGFQALLGLQITIAALSLLVASNGWAVALCSAIIVFGGWLFWKLVRALARLQMPRAAEPPAIASADGRPSAGDSADANPPVRPSDRTIAPAPPGSSGHERTG